MSDKVSRRYLVVRRLGTDEEEVHRVEITGRSERSIEKVERGLLRNMDLDNFWVDDSNEGGLPS